MLSPFNYERGYYFSCIEGKGGLKEIRCIAQNAGLFVDLLWNILCNLYVYCIFYVVNHFIFFLWDTFFSKCVKSTWFIQSLIFKVFNWHNFPRLAICGCNEKDINLIIAAVPYLYTLYVPFLLLISKLKKTSSLRSRQG